MALLANQNLGVGLCREADLRYTHNGAALHLLLNVPRTKAYLSMAACGGVKLEQTFNQQYIIVLASFPGLPRFLFFGFHSV